MRNDAAMTMTEAMETMNEIIRLQSSVIDELFTVALQHIGAEEAGKLPCMQAVGEAVRLRQKIGWEGESL